jgi:hypothetical protein
VSNSSYGDGVTAEGLRLILGFLPSFFTEGEATRKILAEEPERFLGVDAQFIGWNRFYEVPFRQHSLFILGLYMQNEEEGLPTRVDIENWLKQVTDSPGQVGAIPDVAEQINSFFDKLEMPSEEEAEEIRPYLAQILAFSVSLMNSLRCVLYHGCYLNELIDRVRAGDDKALFDAIRIDPTVIGCAPVSTRISKAYLLEDHRFFASLKAALNGRIAKREQANFQKMRMVLEVLHEAGATRLTDDQLHELFVEELKLYSGNAKGGGNAKALRKFADTYMKKTATT